LSNDVVRRRKMNNDETNVGRKWNDIALVNILDLYEVEVF
jgi:hypothetical protein